MRIHFESRAAAFETALIAFGFVVLWVFLPHWPYGDDWGRLNDIQQLLDHGHLTNSPFSLAMPLLSAPFIEIAKQFGTPWYMADHFNVIVTAVGTVVAYRLLRHRLDPRIFRKTILLILFASMFTNILRGYSEVITTTVLAVVGGLVVAFGKRPWLGWAAIVYATVNTPASFGALALIVGVVTWQTRRLRNLLPFVAAVVLFGAEAWARRGSPFSNGEGSDPGFSYPFVLGFVAILFSFGRGILFYIPSLFSWIGPRTRSWVPGKRFVAFMFLYVAGLVLVYAKWWSWYGGTTWGPRFFTFAVVPASFFLAVRILHAGDSPAADAASLTMLLLSGWVGLVGGTANLDTLAAACSRVSQSVCLYAPDQSSLWAPFVSFPHLSASEAIFSAYVVLVVAYLALPLVRSLWLSLAQLVRTVDWVEGWRV